MQPKARHIALSLFALTLIAQTAPTIDTKRVSAHVKILASDDFEGRGPGTPGEQKTVDYIVSQFTAAGVQPGDDLDRSGARRWPQDVPLAQADIAGPIDVSFKTGAKVQALRQGDDIAVRATHLPVGHITIRNAPLVFVGYGVKAPERQWDDFKGV